MKNEMKITENEIRIVSGIYEFVIVKIYTGKKTQRAIKARLTIERSNWARRARAIQEAEYYDYGYDLETGMPCDWPELD